LERGEADIALARETIYLRGLFVNRYSAVEYAIAELVSGAFLHSDYTHLGQPPFGSTRKLKRLRHIIDLPGPIAGYRDELLHRLDEFEQYEEHRNFMANALMVPRSKNDIAFRMYDHREGQHSVGALQFELRHMEMLSGVISTLSSEFTALVARICREIPLGEI